MRRAYVGLGANIGNREATLREAVHRLESLGRIAAVSSLYETEPVGYLEQPPFLNAVAAVETVLDPRRFMQGLLEIERDLGRSRSFPNAPRTIDLDLLLLGEVVMETSEVMLPHPRMHERAFVLAPLAEIASDVVDPARRDSIATLLGSLPTLADVGRFALPGWHLTPREDEETSRDR